MGYQIGPNGRDGKGILVCFNGERVGRWVLGKDPHLIIFDGEDRERHCTRFGCKLHVRDGRRWWRLPESGLADFRQAIEAITGEEMRFHLP